MPATAADYTGAPRQICSREEVEEYKTGRNYRDSGMVAGVGGDRVDQSRGQSSVLIYTLL